MKYRIRAAGHADLRALVELAADTFPDSTPPGSTAENVQLHIAQNLNAEKFADYLRDDAAQVFLAEGPERPVGYNLSIHGEPHQREVAEQLRYRPESELSKFYVRTQVRGTAVPAALMATTLAAAAERGSHGMWLGVSSVNERAKRFYAKHGFSRIGSKTFRFGQRNMVDDVLERALRTGGSGRGGAECP